MKTPVVNREHYIIYLEKHEENFFIHCDVLTKWTKEVKKELQKDFKILTENWDKDLFALHTPSDFKHKKFLKMFGFTFLRSVKGIDNNDYDIYVWR
jgi:hypothetical protein